MEDVWLSNIETGEGWLVYQGHATIVDWSPDGKKLVLVSRDGLHVYWGFDQIAEIEF